MSPIAIGIALGLAAGIVQFVAFQRVMSGLRAKAETDAEAARKVRLLNAFAWIDLAVFPALGGLLGMTIADGGFAP